MQDLITNLVGQLDTVALLLLILALTTALKKFLRRVEYDGEAVGWLQSISHYARKVLEFASANDGDAERDQLRD